MKTLAHLHTSIKIANEEVCIDPMTLFSRLIALMMRENDVAPYFEYELSPYPASLFKNGVMRDTTKSKLRNRKISKMTIYLLVTMPTLLMVMPSYTGSNGSHIIHIIRFLALVL